MNSTLLLRELGHEIIKALAMKISKKKPHTKIAIAGTRSAVDKCFPFHYFAYVYNRVR